MDRVVLEHYEHQEEARRLSKTKSKLFGKRSISRRVLWKTTISRKRVLTRVLRKKVRSFGKKRKLHIELTRNKTLLYYHDFGDLKAPCRVVNDHHDTVHFLGAFPCLQDKFEHCHCDAKCNDERHKDCCSKCWDAESLG